MNRFNSYEQHVGFWSWLPDFRAPLIAIFSFRLKLNVATEKAFLSEKEKYVNFEKISKYVNAKRNADTDSYMTYFRGIFEVNQSCQRASHCKLYSALLWENGHNSV